MGRRTQEVTITAEGRDAGKKYLVTEMSAAQAEKWALRVLNGLATAKVDLGAVVPMMGMSGLAQWSLSMGIVALDGIFRMPWELAEPLIDEMMGCVQYVPPSGPRALNENMGDIEEVATRLQLREEVLSLHLGFSIRDRLSTAISQLQTAADPTSSNTPTSPEPSES